MQKNVVITFDSEDMKEHYGLREGEFNDFVDYMSKTIPNFISESNFLENHAERFKSIHRNAWIINYEVI